MEAIKSSRILYGSKPPKSFIEEADFDISTPYFIRVKQPENSDFAPPHYSKDTIELLLCDRVSGEISIFQKRCILDSQCRYAFVIPPGAVHSTTFSAGEGVVYVLQISLSDMSQLINLNSMLSLLGLYIDDLVFSAPTFEDLFPFVSRMIEQDGNLFECFRCLLSIIELLYASLQRVDCGAPKQRIQSSSELKKVISWTNENYASSITVSDVSHMIGMSPTYFCSWFKAKTGLTYMQYLNQVRISNAARLLSLGETTSAAAYTCGFQNVSYFIQVFKRVEGCTPKEFKRRFTA